MLPPALGELRHLVERHDAELRRLVAQAARAGARTQDIADAVGVSRSTLWRRYGTELRRDGSELRVGNTHKSDAGGLSR